MKLAMRFIQEEDGQDLVEYALLLSLLVLGAVTGVGAFGSQLDVYWGSVISGIQSFLGS